jgi:hypothetical protein
VASERGQASLELLAGIPLLVAVALVCLQLLVTGQASALADGAVEAAAIALASGREPEPAARGALPDWADERIEVEHRRGRVIVRLRPPSPIAAVSRVLEVSATAWVRRPELR